ncbi:hypothetical protein [Haloarchaeobius sp. TZWWS8]|uniref:hypothetical protein n=1 Tax=Haloarchaeobius sp. TZWWS8 TaxID=3446121 RepID=UPI003EC0047D
MTVPRLADLRGDRRRRAVATAAAVVVGLGLVWVHWLGLLLAGALVALPQERVRRGIAAALCFGTFVLCVFLVEFALVGALGKFGGMGTVATLPVAIALGLPTFGSLSRAIV